jgi:hypothetical protein
MNKIRLDPRQILLTVAMALLAVILCGPPCAAGEIELNLPPLKNRPDGFAGLKWGDNAGRLGDDGIMFSEDEGSSEQYIVMNHKLALELSL